MMTSKMRECLEVISGEISAKGISPSYEALCQDLKLKSKSGINRLVVELAGRGMITYKKNAWNAIEITDKGYTALKINKTHCPCCNQELPEVDEIDG